MKQIASIVFVCMIALAGASCERRPSVEAAVERTGAATVAVSSVTRDDLSRGLVLTGEFKPYQDVEVMAKVSGYVKRINVDIGDRVRQGQVLAILEVPEMNDDAVRARAAIDRSQSEVARASDEVRRAESSHRISHLSFDRLDSVAKSRPGLVAQQEIDDAQSKDLVSEAQVAAAKSGLAAAAVQVRVYQAELQKLNTMFAYTRVLAPFDGIVTRRFADTGSMIQAGTASQTQAMPLVRLAQNSLLRLILPVPESAVPTVHAGQTVEVKVPTLNRSFAGRVVRFAESISRDTRTMDTEVDVPNPSLLLVPGMYAEVDLTLARHDHVLSIPVEAVDLRTGDGPPSGRVLVVTAGNLVEEREVSIGLETAEKLEVRSGLDEGELVVLSGRAGLRAGQVVKPKLTQLTASDR